MSALSPHEDPRRTAYVVKLENTVNNMLEKLERLGWPFRLEELPDKYDELQKKYVALLEQCRKEKKT